ncbi:hypothetical protein [Leptospira sp. GIMC2001]|uniref:hypothetical protein n=1 Tax=Leptospira sp. GIMC2001 TaxID=1513297 RepID=UPI002349DEEE|nr:hypothetical protein [Leptospira sp. GIMC2001]WCL49557.1 hypothetical protein O4O04_01700 [Leptospira sp. GIMC2001]
MESQKSDNLEELIEKIKSGEIYGEIQLQLETKLRSRKARSKKNSQIDDIQATILKKETEITKILSEIIKLKNDLSNLLEKELDI